MCVCMPRVRTQALYFNITESVNDTSLPVRVNNAGVNERNMFGTSLKLDYVRPLGTLTSITAYDRFNEPDRRSIQFPADSRNRCCSISSAPIRRSISFSRSMR